MPFATTLELDNDSGQLFMVDITDVDRDKDRLVLVFEKEDAAGELVFALVDHESGARLLRLDRDNSAGYAVADLDRVIRQVRPFGNPDKGEVYLATEEFSDVDLTLNLPPSIAMSLLNGRLIKIDAVCELKLEDGETVTVESRTLG